MRVFGKGTHCVLQTINAMGVTNAHARYTLGCLKSGSISQRSSSIRANEVPSPKDTRSPG
jgi:hypothetical protein